MATVNQLRKTYLSIANKGVQEWEKMHLRFMRQTAPEGQAKRVILNAVKRVCQGGDFVHPMTPKDHLEALRIAMDVMREEEQEGFCDTLGAMDFERRAYGDRNDY